MIRYTEEMKQFIRENIKGVGNKELTEKFNSKFGTDVTAQQIKSYKANNKLSSGLTGHFETGHTPHNKGQKGIRYKGCEKTWFKKGHAPKNHREVGSQRISKDGYIEIKVAEPRKWRLKHNVVWEEVNGKVPENHVVIFLDKNKQNLNISNLKLIRRSELLIMNRNNMFSENKDITEVSSNIAKLIDSKNKIKNKNEKG